MALRFTSVLRFGLSLLAFAWGANAFCASSWYDAAGMLASWTVTSAMPGAECANDEANGQESAKSRNERRHDEEDSVREDAAKLRRTMNTVIAEYDKIGAGELARQCIDASRIIQIAEHPGGWREILFLLAGLVSLLAALFITKILASMFKVEIAQLLWIPIAACITLLISLFVAIHSAKKHKIAIASGIALSAAGVISFVNPVRHAFFSAVADIFVIFTAIYVPLAASAIGFSIVLFFFSRLWKPLGGGFESVWLFLLRNLIGFVAIPGVCAILFLAILSVVGPWFEGYAGEVPSSWGQGEYEPFTETPSAATSIEALSVKAVQATRGIDAYSRRVQHLSTSSTSQSAPSRGGMIGFKGGKASTGRQASAFLPSDIGAIAFSAFPRKVRQTAVEMAWAAEGVYDGILPQGAKPFDGFLTHPVVRSMSSPSWNGSIGIFTTSTGLVAQIFRRSIGLGKMEMVVIFRGLASAKTGLEDWGRISGGEFASQHAEAASLLRAIGETTDLPIVVLGHSLGGSLTQYAVAMNQERGNLRGVGFNSAGLSSNLLGDIERFEGGAVHAARSLAMVRLDNDPFSTTGVLLGRVVTVASDGARGLDAHSMTKLVEAMVKAAQ